MLSGGGAVSLGARDGGIGAGALGIAGSSWVTSSAAGEIAIVRICGAAVGT